jgi:hypothetical protein
MDPVTALAATAVTALVPYLAKAGEKIAEEAGKVVADKIGVLYQFLRQRFENKPELQAVFKLLEANPKSQDAQAAMRVQLAVQLTQDKAFEDSLRQMVEEIQQDPVSQSFITKVYGGEVGQIVNAGHIGTVTYTKDSKTNATPPEPGR